jgi:hypothetical protein
MRFILSCVWFTYKNWNCLEPYGIPIAAFNTLTAIPILKVTAVNHRRITSLGLWIQLDLVDVASLNYYDDFR